MIDTAHTALEAISSAVHKAAAALLAAIMLAMVTFTGLQVGCRYLGSGALSWPEEVNVFFMVWITFIGSSIALKTSEHIGIDLFVSMLPRTLYLTARLLGHLVMTGLLLLVTRFGYKVAMMNTTVVSDALGIPMVIPRMGLVVGGLMMLVQMSWLLITDIRDLTKPAAPEKNAGLPPDSPGGNGRPS